MRGKRTRNGTQPTRGGTVTWIELRQKHRNKKIYLFYDDVVCIGEVL